ncbi:nicotinate-nucleotide diphosphorylase (carboxylating) [Helicobacter monodelphidis]|uniref:carboxylating nicotinate-nucleotide diphosphorylase n=1 Tax=Helicobacter sp. 15-1451 TaxID=2004995 RepID=UPI000DCD818C|nr:carboxylating nicotinate-nucleotide diphosphorylase [Helicobacter sp. 15-1451]RAX59307.1 nicotinate-nucleotide diphosphorylase (carboxylating) [Helicobacter sp. 15-1451]
MLLQQDIQQFVKSAIKEDVGRHDIFGILGLNHRIKGSVLAKEKGIFSGEVYAKTLLEFYGIQYVMHKLDGEYFEKNDILLQVEGCFSDVLIIERTLLNILQHSSGIATLTHSYVRALNNPRIKLLDTRKTRPLLREFEKYSVRNGGGINHRFGLDDCVMLKDTHRMGIVNLKQTIAQIRSKFWGIVIEVESENLEEFKESCFANADIVMCDNMSVSEIQECVEYRNSNYPHIQIEVSGGICLENLSDYSSLDIDAISIGSMIHHAQFVDLSMKIQK